jgi:zinc transporter ZupT
MSVGKRPPDARPVFRTWAIGLAISCFVLAVVFGFVADREVRLPAAGVCAVVGVIMAVIGLTGYWPPRRSS